MQTLVFATNSVKEGVVTNEETRFFDFGPYCNNYSTYSFWLGN